MFRKCVALILLLSMGVFPMKVLAQHSNTHSKAETDIAEVSDEYKRRVQRLRLQYMGIGGIVGWGFSLFVIEPMAELLFPDHNF